MEVLVVVGKWMFKTCKLIKKWFPILRLLAPEYQSTIVESAWTKHLMNQYTLIMISLHTSMTRIPRFSKNKVGLKCSLIASNLIIIELLILKNDAL